MLQTANESGQESGPPSRQEPQALLKGDMRGDMRSRIAAFDWAQTPLGTASEWPQSLTSAVETLLASQVPMLVWWGPTRIQFYNDAYVAALGQGHPWGLGRPAATCWEDAWPAIGALAEQVTSSGFAVRSEALPVVVSRSGFPEEVYVTFSCSPVVDAAGEMGGLFCVCTEETERVLSRRRLAALGAMGKCRADVTLAQACELITTTLADICGDLPFTQLYLLDEEKRAARLMGQTGVERGIPAIPLRVGIKQQSSGDDEPWPFSAVMASGRMVTVNLPTTAAVLPLAYPGRAGFIGFLVAGINPRLAFDDSYQTFLNLLAQQVTAALAAAGAFEEEQHRIAHESADAETALRESEARLSAALESVPAGIAVIDSSGKLILTNKEYLRFLPTRTMPSRDPERLNRWRGWDDQGRLLEPKDWPGARALRGENVVPGQQMLYTDDDGREIWTNVATVPTRDSMGNVTGCVSVISDITGHKAAEEALRQSEMHLAAELRHTALLHSLAARMVTEANVNSIYAEILATAIAITQADAGAVQVYDPETHSLLLLVTQGFPDKMADRFHRMDAVSKTACGMGLRTGMRSFVDFDQNDEDESCRALLEMGFQSAQATPLLSHEGSPIGMLNTHWRVAGYRPGVDQLRFLDLLARQAADLIEQRRAQDTLREREERYRELFERIDEGFAIIEMIFEGERPVDYRFIEVNPAFERHTGISNAVGRLMRDIAPDHEQYWFDHYGEIARTGQPQRFEAPAMALDRYYDLHAFRVGDPAQCRVAVLFSDISERRRAEMALRESEMRLREREADLARVQRIGEVGGLDIDVVNGLSSRRSPEYLRLHGLPEDFRNETHADWRARVHPDDLELAEQRLFAALESDARSYESEYRIIRQNDGAVRWIAARADIERDADGKALRLIGAHIDVTEQKRVHDALRKSEERLRRAAEAARFALWDWNLQTAEIFWSDELFRMTGYAVGEVTPSYETWSARVHPDDLAEAEAAIGFARRTDTEYIHEFRSLHPDGSVRWLSARGRFLYDASGDPYRMIGVMLDTTERRESEERQKVLVAELQHRTFNLMGMVRSIADATIRSSVDLHEFKQKFDDRIAALARVQRLLSRLNDDDRVTFDELIRSELDAVGALQENNGCVILDGPGGVALRSSTVQTFAMALHELTTNAVKYGALKQPGARLTVRWQLEIRETGQPWLHVDWHETGVSMATIARAPQGTGQGRALIEKALPYQLRARTTYTLTEEGVHCTIALPVSSRSLRN